MSDPESFQEQNMEEIKLVEQPEYTHEPIKDVEKAPTTRRRLSRFGFKYSLQLDVMFPTRMSFIVWIVYLLFLTNYGLIAHWSKNDKGEYEYDPACMMIIIEGVKLVISLGVTVYQEGLASTVQIFRSNSKILLLYMFPSGLYAIYNNLSFFNLKNYPPAVYSLFIELKLLVLGFCYQIMFNRKLSRIQWISLLILTFSILLKQVNFDKLDGGSLMDALQMNKFIWIIAQIVSSCVASVYNEYLLRKYSSTMGTWVQNVCNYSNGVIMNLLIMSLFYDGKGQNIGFVMTISTLRLPHYLIILNQALLGISAAFLLKHINSIVKSMCFPVVLMLQSLIGYICFGITMTAFSDYLAFALAGLAIYIYALNPIEQLTVE